MTFDSYCCCAKQQAVYYVVTMATKSIKKAQDELIAELDRQRAILKAKYGIVIVRRPYRQPYLLED